MQLPQSLQQRPLLLHLLLLLFLPHCLPPQSGAVVAVAAADIASSARRCRFSVVEGQAPVNAAIGGPSLYSCLGYGDLREEKDDEWRLEPPSEEMGGSKPGGKQVWELLKVGSNGSLQVASSIDREDPSLRCYNQEVCSKRFSVLLHNRRLNRILKQVLVLDIHDYNDNSPKFGQENRELHVLENLNNQLFTLPSVTDLDAGKNGQTMTRIVGHDASVPRQDVLENPNSENPNLRVTPALDYEIVQGYNITLEACDAGAVATPCTRIQVRITVTDVNDNRPRFAVRELRLPDISEDAFKKSGLSRLPIGKLEASDPDGGDNGRIEFSLLRGQGSESFEVDAQTGELFQVASVNAALTPELTLTVRARDFGRPSRLKDTATVKLHFVDVNDHRPLVSTVGSEQPRLVEGRPNLNFASISTSDSDLGDFGRVACGLDSDSSTRFVLKAVSADQDGTSGGGGFSFKQFSVSTRPGLVYDREVQASDTVGILCWDHGSPSLTSSLTLTASIEDVNEFPPVFNDTVVYSFRVAENQTAGELVGKMTAYDRDATAAASAVADEFSLRTARADAARERQRRRLSPAALRCRSVAMATGRRRRRLRRGLGRFGSRCQRGGDPRGAERRTPRSLHDLLRRCVPSSIPSRMQLLQHHGRGSHASAAAAAAAAATLPTARAHSLATQRQWLQHIWQKRFRRIWQPASHASSPAAATTAVHISR